MRLCDYCLGGMAVLPVLEIGELVFCDADCAERHIRQVKAALAAANERIAALEAQLGGNVFTRTEAAINELGRALGVR